MGSVQRKDVKTLNIKKYKSYLKIKIWFLTYSVIQLDMPKIK